MKQVIIISSLLAILANGQEILRLDLGNRVLEINTTIRLSWLQAHQSCAAKGMQLVTIRSAEENHRIANFLSANSLIYIWTAGTDLFEPNVFRWVNNGEIFVLNFWGPNHDSNKRCMELRTSLPNNWYDERCDLAQLYLCETIGNNDRRNTTARSSTPSIVTSADNPLPVRRFQFVNKTKEVTTDFSQKTDEPISDQK